MPRGAGLGNEELEFSLYNSDEDNNDVEINNRGWESSEWDI